MDNYGEVLVKATGGILWSYEQYGDYQGDYIAIIEKDNELQIYKGVFGSCSGCDWLSKAGEYINEDDTERTINQEEINEYAKDFKPFLAIPRASIPETAEELVALLPANTRVWLNDGYSDIKLENILNQLQHPIFNNLEYLEAKHDQKINADE